jgi:hypothetical protein
MKSACYSSNTEQICVILSINRQDRVKNADIRSGMNNQITGKMKNRFPNVALPPSVIFTEELLRNPLKFVII